MRTAQASRKDNDQRAANALAAKAHRGQLADQARRQAFRLSKFDNSIEFRHIDRACRIAFLTNTTKRDEAILRKARELEAAETNEARYAWDMVQRYVEDHYHTNGATWFQFLNASERTDHTGRVLVLSGRGEITSYVDRRYFEVFAAAITESPDFIAVEIHNEEEVTDAGHN